MITIHSLKDCYYCEKAKDFLDSLEMDYSVVDYDKDDEGYKEKVEELSKVTNKTKFPQIFIHGEYIGGYHELLTLYDF
mgnify:CR=1 FL=1